MKENTIQNPGAVKTKVPATPEQKKASAKNWFGIFANFILAYIAVYAFEFWYDKVIELDLWLMLGNFTVVGLLAITFFIAATAYTRGTVNKAVLWLTLIVMAAVIIGLMLLVSPTEKDFLFPFSGVLIVMIGFYMLYLSTDTMEPVGIFAMIILFWGGIFFAKYFGLIDWSWVAELSQLAVFCILFFGGTWAKLRYAMHGITGVNKDGGHGDSSDGSGEAED